MKTLLPTNSTSPISDLVMSLNNFHSHLKLQIICFSQYSNILNLFREVSWSLYHIQGLRFADEAVPFGFQSADLFCGLGYLSNIKTVVSFMQPGWFLFKIYKKPRLCESLVKQCATLWTVWSPESFSLMNFLTSAPLSPPFLCTWFQDALFWVTSLGSCASILAIWDTVYMWGSTTRVFLKLTSLVKKCHKCSCTET